MHIVRDMKKKLILNTIMSLLLQITAVICGFIVPRLMLQYYGSKINGLVQSIAQFLQIISFLELGVGQVIQSSLYKPLSVGSTEGISQVLKSGTTYFRKIAYAILVYICLLTMIFPYMVNGEYGWNYTVSLIFSMGIGLFAQYYFGLIDKILLNADQKMYIQNANLITGQFMLRRSLIATTSHFWAKEWPVVREIYPYFFLS